MSEINEQAKAYQYIYNKYPAVRKMLFHVPNGGKRTKIEAGQLKAAGVVAGIPDLLLFWKMKIYPVEMKVPGGYVSDDQKEVHRIWKAAGIHVEICWSAEEAIKYYENIILTA